MRKRGQYIRRRLQWAGLCCMFAYLVALGWVAPLAAAALAAADQSHEVQVSVGESGARVVLAHPSAGAAAVAWHDHSATVAALVALASDTGPHGDHVLAFPAGVQWARPVVGVLDVACGLAPPVMIPVMTWSLPSPSLAWGHPAAESAIVPSAGRVFAGVFAILC